MITIGDSTNRRVLPRVALIVACLLALGAVVIFTSRGQDHSAHAAAAPAYALSSAESKCLAQHGYVASSSAAEAASLAQAAPVTSAAAVTTAAKEFPGLAKQTPSMSAARLAVSTDSGPVLLTGKDVVSQSITSGTMWVVGYQGLSMVPPGGQNLPAAQVGSTAGSTPSSLPMITGLLVLVDAKTGIASVAFGCDAG